jgi:hypothetical protein
MVAVSRILGHIRGFVRRNEPQLGDFSGVPPKLCRLAHERALQELARWRCLTPQTPQEWEA